MNEPTPAPGPGRVDPVASRLAGGLFFLAAAIFAVVAVLRASRGESITSMVALASMFAGLGAVFLSLASQSRGTGQ